MDILRTASDVILLRHPNFTDYWDHTSPSFIRPLTIRHGKLVTVMKTIQKKLKPKNITYRNYKSFSNNSFREALQQIVSNEDTCDANFGNFISTCNRILDKQSPHTKKTIYKG